MTDNRCDCYEPDLTLRWRVDENSTPSSDCTVFGAAVADINGDGELEVILSGGHWRNGIRETGLFVISKAGAVLCFTRLASSTWMRSLPTIYDIDGDQQLEIISNDDSGQIYCSRWNGGTGQLEVVWQKSLSSSPLNGSPLLLDVNGDGMREVLVPVAEGKVYVLRGSDGGILATIDHGYSTDIESVATGGDLNGDGKTEFLVPLTTVGRLLCYQGNNQTFAGNWFRRWGATPQRTGFVRDTDSG